MTSSWPRWRLKSQALTIVYSTVYSCSDKENIKTPRHWRLGEFTGGRRIPRTNRQWRGYCSHLMTSSWMAIWGWVKYTNIAFKELRTIKQTDKRTYLPTFWQVTVCNMCAHVLWHIRFLLGFYLLWWCIYYQWCLYFYQKYFMVMYSCIVTYECVFYYVLGQRWPNKQVKSNQSVYNGNPNTHTFYIYVHIYHCMCCVVLMSLLTASIKPRELVTVRVQSLTCYRLWCFVVCYNRNVTSQIKKSC